MNFLDVVDDDLLVELADVERHQVVNEVDKKLPRVLAIRGH